MSSEGRIVGEGPMVDFGTSGPIDHEKAVTGKQCGHVR
jgi:hypothetical protein